MIAAVVLAAGRGERLGGRSKAALLLGDGRSFVAAVVDAARAAGVAKLIVVAAAPHEAVTRAAARAAGVGAGDVVTNAAPERGMASSFACGVAALADGAYDAVLCWPVDHPFVRVATVAALVARATPGSIVVPECGGRGGHPTLFGASFLPACLAAAEAPDGLRTVLRANAARVVRLGCDDPGVVRDVDTLDDFERLGETPG
jgi:molybdenum cofactor cytidylyltransferase